MRLLCFPDCYCRLSLRIVHALYDKHVALVSLPTFCKFRSLDPVRDKNERNVKGMCTCVLCPGSFMYAYTSSHLSLRHPNDLIPASDYDEVGEKAEQRRTGQKRRAARNTTSPFPSSNEETQLQSCRRFTCQVLPTINAMRARNGNIARGQYPQGGGRALS